MTKVDITKTVEYSTLEDALRKAAKEVGWKFSIRDVFEESYKLGSVQEIKEYNYTVVRLSSEDRRGLIQSTDRATVMIYGRTPKDKFIINRSVLGYTTEEEIKKYLDAVSRNL